MTIADLPVGSKPPALPVPHFPTRFQAVIWRNWGLVDPGRLALVLQTGSGEVLRAAAALGLETPDPAGYPVWAERGFLTLIRRNWHLLNYEQLLELLDWTPERLAFVLKEDDFFWIKLGQLKPECEPVVYRELTPEEARRTETIREWLRRELAVAPAPAARPFDFVLEPESGDEVEPDDLRLIYSYTALYGDPLLGDPEKFYPDGELRRYRRQGINGIWFQTPLYSLVPWAGETSWSRGWRERLEALRRLTERAARHGIRVFLYINEPRAMPEEFFRFHPDWQGAVGRVHGCIAMCPSAPGMLDALRHGIRQLHEAVPQLGGLIAITMSENLTHCQSYAPEGIAAVCPRCTGKTPDQLVHSVLSAIRDGQKDAATGGELIAWNWGWVKPWDETLARTLPADIRLMLVSETGVETHAGDTVGAVLDYSISKPGPGPTALRLLECARAAGRRVMVKVQVNNSWELAAVPYLAVPGLVRDHLERLRTHGVRDFMLSWTHGGYPGGNLEMLDHTPRQLAIRDYGAEAAPEILAAWHDFETAFTAFPFHSVGAIYFGPQHAGPSALLYREPTGYHATMVGFPYDDLTAWRGNHFPEAVFRKQFQRLSDQWQQGLRHWRRAEALLPDDAGVRARWASNFRLAEAAGIHWRSSLLQIEAAMRHEKTQPPAPELLKEEADLARSLFRLQRQDARIGFEASNHYFYTPNDLLEKILNCNDLIR